METTPQTVREALTKLRELSPIPPERRVAALEQFWQRVTLAPPQETGQFPWAQVQRGITALAESAPRCLEPENLEKPGVLALVLAGNTPLLAWPTLHYAVLLGIPVFIKQSRDELIWTCHFVETLKEIDPKVAALLYLETFPGDDPRTQTLIQNADAVIAYGSDKTVEALRQVTPETTPFQSFGHAVSIGFAFEDYPFACDSFAQDILMYDQQGCLSPQIIFCEPDPCLSGSYTQDDVLVNEAEHLVLQMGSTADSLDVPDRVSAQEITWIREACDLALFDGAQIAYDSEWRWIVITYPPVGRDELVPKLSPIGFGCVWIVPVWSLERHVGEILGLYQGLLSCVGVAGELSEELLLAIEAEGVSRICRAGQMQTPPLDWRNGAVDLREWLKKCEAA